MGLTIWPPQGDIDGPATSTVNAAVVWGDTTGTSALDGASVNVLGKQFVGSFTTTATAAGTTTLTVSSNLIQAFTGVTTQTVVLPVVTTLPKTGFQFVVINDSTGALTVNSSGANLVQTMAAGSRAVFTCILLTGTTAASWAVTYTPVSVSIPFTAASASGSASLAFAEDTDNGSHAVTLKAPAAVTANVDVTLPDAAGTVALTSNINGGATVYQALLTQTSTNAPVATVLEKTITGTLTWARTNPGEYTLTSDGTPFAANKVYILCGSSKTDAYFLEARRTSTSVITLYVYFIDESTGDDQLQESAFTVLVYP